MIAAAAAAAVDFWAGIHGHGSVPVHAVQAQRGQAVPGWGGGVRVAQVSACCHLQLLLLLLLVQQVTSAAAAALKADGYQSNCRLHVGLTLGSGS